MKNPSNYKNNPKHPHYTFKQIFTDHWTAFVFEMNGKGKPIRTTIHEEIDKLINCQNPKKGVAIYLCEDCNRVKHVPFTCKSRFCNTCGVKYSKERALSMSSVLINGEHRHVVFTIPEELRPFFAYNRKLLNVLFKSVSETLYHIFKKRNKAMDYTPGFISVLHTFGRDLKWNPHIHVILSANAVSKHNTWKTFTHINYEALRKCWRFFLINNLQEAIPNFKSISDKMYQQYSNGFYVNAPPVKDFSPKVIDYILRYAGRPVMAQSRIKNYDGENVTFTYTPHESEQFVTETISVHDFIARLIIHIPDREFKMIRYSADNMPAKWQVLLLLGQKTILNLQTSPA